MQRASSAVRIGADAAQPRKNTLTAIRTVSSILSRLGGARHPGQRSSAGARRSACRGTGRRAGRDPLARCGRSFLLLRDPFRHDAVGGMRAGLVEQPAGLGERAADRNHEPVKFENWRRQHHREERVARFRSVALPGCRRGPRGSPGRRPAFLPDHGFEQAFLAAEPRVDRRLRAADHADDLVDRDVVVALLQEQRPRQANDALAALLGGLQAAGTACAGARPSARRPLRILKSA